MPDDPLANAVETFSAPIESVIIALGQGIAAAQQALDQNSVATQEAIDTDPTMSQYGLQATWYQFPTVNMQLKMSMTITQDQTSSSSPSSATPSSATPGVASPRAVGPIMASQLFAPRYRVIAQPLSASFQNHFNYDATAATQINLTMMPVPPPRSGNQVTTPPSMTPAAVQAAALASTAGFITATNAQGATVDPAGDVLAMLTNYNAAAGTWYVIQYAPSNAAFTPISVAVDDATHSVRIISTGAPASS
jgi:hypothetical protein